jgi:dephospho-CoA kinase
VKITGLTGSIGMGKSTVAAMFADEGVPVFDADAEVHRLQGKGGALVAAIEAAFPGSTTDGAVDRQKLGGAVFGDPDALKRLEAIVHPAVAKERAAFLARHSDAPLIVFDIPLLLEKGRPADVDAVVVVSAPPDIQRTRVLARPGMTVEKFEQISARQLSDAEKQRQADYIIDTGTDLTATRARVREVIACLTPAMGPS